MAASFELDAATGLPIGVVVDGGPASRPLRRVLEGRWVRIEPLDRAHAGELHRLVQGAENDRLWRYLAYGPFADSAGYQAWVEKVSAGEDPLFFAIVDTGSGRALGHAALMRIDAVNRAIEIGNILYVPALQRTCAATEAMYLFMRHVFEDLGYRRYEWKCDALNAPSRKAALRLGFQFEGIFREHMIIKGRSRDTAWYSMLGSEWPALKARFERWLDPSNFDESGRQIRPLNSGAMVP